MKLTKTEIRDIQSLYKTFDPNKVVGGKDRTFYTVLIISRGRKRIHRESGYPYMQAIGVSRQLKFYNLGEHDTISLNYDSFGIESLGKNVFQIWPKGKVKELRTPEYFTPVGELSICDNTKVTPINTVM